MKLMPTTPHLGEFTIAKDLLAQIPEATARAYQAIPIRQSGANLEVAMVDPDNQEIIELLQAKTGKLIAPVKIDQPTLAKLLNQYSAIMELTAVHQATGADQDSPAIKIVDSLLRQAIRDRASDIHIEPEPDGTVVRLRIDGLLRPVITLPLALHRAIVSRVKILSNLKIDVTRLPQDGRFQTNLEGKAVDYRISTYPTVDGEKIVMRILDKSKGLLTLEQLGVVGQQFTFVKEAIHKPHGMILVTGPTGSGKSTTLYAILQQLHKPDVNIITLEDPVEYRMPGINQGQIHPEIGFTFAVGLRSILRQDPDIVMIGEIRDLESAELAVQAALTGHIVLSTLHTNDSVGAIPRLLDIGIPPFLLNASLNLVVAQRLARKLCDKCKQPTSLSEADQKVTNDILATIPGAQKLLPQSVVHFFKAVGCHECSNGYSGRVGIFEVLPISDAIKALIVKDANAQAIAQKAKTEGMLVLLQDGVLKAAQGITTIEEVWRITKV